MEQLSGNGERSPRPEWLTTDWVLSLFGKRKKLAMARCRQYVLEGVQYQPEIGANLKGQIYLGNEDFVAEMQKRIGKEKDDLNIPKQQKRPIAKPLSKIAAQHKDRKTAIIAAYKTGAYSQPEIAEFYQLHPATARVIVRKNKNALFWT